MLAGPLQAASLPKRVEAPRSEQPLKLAVEGCSARLPTPGSACRAAALDVILEPTGSDAGKHEQRVRSASRRLQESNGRSRGVNAQ